MFKKPIRRLDFLIMFRIKEKIYFSVKLFSTSFISFIFNRDPFFKLIIMKSQVITLSGCIGCGRFCSK
jgi:hypothetical protein